MMRRTSAILLAVVCVGSAAYPQHRAKHIRQGNSVVCADVRFQFLTESLGRAEYSPNQRFVDAPTAVVLRRQWAPVDLQVEEKDGVLTARTSHVTLRYVVSPGSLRRDNLRIMWRDDRGEHSWAPGDSDKANLGGITYSLDGARKGRLPEGPQGILSRSGYFVLDDSRTPIWDTASSWITPRGNTGGQDLYWIVYGDDYGLALREYARLCGEIPMVPRYVLGTWITDLNYEYLENTDYVRKYDYTDENIRRLVTRFRDEMIPLDVLVLDFAWHKFGWKGGYDWSPIFPDPQGFLKWTRSQGIKVSLNDHPGYGKEAVLSHHDSHAEEIRNLLGFQGQRKPGLQQDISDSWKFRIDSSDAGLRAEWYSESTDDRSWPTLAVGRTWEDQGYPTYDGIAWYRKRVPLSLPSTADSLFLTFTGADDEYDLFVDGKKVAHYGGSGSSVWNTTTYTNIRPFITPGTVALIAVRVNDWGGGGGLGEASLSDVSPVGGIRFNLALKNHAEAFMKILHNPLVDLGADFWWVDGGSGSCEMEGLSSQMWTNRVFYEYTGQHTGKRAFIFSRYGGWGNHRYPGFFTGDTYGQWEVLAHQVSYTARGGNVLMPYITHDIGGFIGKNISIDLYARWFQFGVFSPLVRLHSAYENPEDGNVRMPWTYGRRGTDLVREYAQLRHRLIPYVYSYCRTATDSALPLVRPLYLEYPRLGEAYARTDEYFFGKEILVAPIVDSTGEREIYLPPGEWFALFTDSQYTGPVRVREKHSLGTMPVFVRSGSIIPGQPVREYSDKGLLDTLLLDVYGKQDAVFNLYEDDGTSLDYRGGKCAWTQFRGQPLSRDGYKVVVDPSRGDFSGQAMARAYEIRLHGFAEPTQVRVNGKRFAAGARKGAGWSFDNRRSIVRVRIAPQDIRKATSVVINW